ncbi:polysaccharide biosynthesis C-terminal domain-containing protein [Maribacter stanieri]|uniref:oligosaccharide flippase family protein n=1 Tax=Maribacter stanieri TaxID=440514 RepID=UPI0024941636|nr:polysaccharide biosynthesis C-terminal domain-containing protein [Maribacter stanieri]
MATFLKDISKVGFSKILIIGCGVLNSVIVARTLGPEKNGIIASVLVYPAIFLIFSSLGISNASTFFLGKGLIAEKEIKKAICYIWCFTSLFSIFSCYLLLHFFTNVETDNWIIILAILPIPFTLLNTYNSGVYLGKNQIDIFNKISWVPYAITLSLTIFFLVIFNFGIKGFFYAYLGGPVFIFVVLLFKSNLFKYLKGVPNWPVIRQMLQLGSVYALALVIVKLHYQIDIILLNQLSTPYEVGIYTKGAVITEYLWQIPMLFNTVVFARSAISKDDRVFSLKVVQLLRISLVIIGVAGLVLELLSNFIVTLFYGKAFEESSSVLMILVPGVLLLTFYKILNTDLHGKGKPWVAIKAMLPGLIINVLLNLYLIPKFGSDGAAMSSTISYSFAAIIFIIIYSKEVDIPLRQIFNFKINDFDPIFQMVNKIFKINQ